MDAPLDELTGLYFPEALRWHEGALWFSDMFDSRVVRWVPGAPATTVLDRTTGGPEIPGGLGWLPADEDHHERGALLVVDCTGKRVLAVRDGHVAIHADLGAFFSFPANDMHVEPDGTAWVGSYGFDPEADEPRESPLVRIDPDGSASATAAGFVFPNGCELDATGALIVAETFGDRLSVHDGTRRTLVTFPPGSGPDGLSIGPDGTIYVALAFARQLVAVSSDSAGGSGIRVVYSAPSEGEAPLACYDCAVEPGGRRIAIALASADEALAQRVSTGHIILLDLPRA